MAFAIRAAMSAGDSVGMVAAAAVGGAIIGGVIVGGTIVAGVTVGGGITSGTIGVGTISVSTDGTYWHDRCGRSRSCHGGWR